MTFSALRCAAFLLMTCTLGAGVRAESTVDCPPPAPLVDTQRVAQLKERARDRGPLWRVEKDGRVSWLYGTIHVGRVEWLYPGPRIVDAIRASDIVALELDFSDAAALQAELARSSAATPERPLDDADKALLAAEMARQCLPPERMNALPGALQVMAVMISASRRDGFHPEFAIDGILTGIARGFGKRIVGLETMQQQLELLRGTGEERHMVQDTLKKFEPDKRRAMFKRLAAIWEAGDEKELAAYREWCECMDDPVQEAWMTRLADDRNVRMAERLVQLHAQGTRTFTAVGMLHMVGDKGLPQLLRQRGFQVEKVKFNP